MSTDNTVEYNSLSWVKKQLDGVLTEAQTSLNDYIENGEQEDLQQSIDHLKLVYGTLQMVEVYGASMLAEEMQQTASALLQGEVERIEDAFDVLMRAMLQLPDYLENIQAGAKDTPILLMPLINDLRASRNDSLLSESVLFVAQTDDVELAAEDYDASKIEQGQLEAEIKRLRTHFQLGLLDYLRNGKERAGLQRIQAVLLALEKVTYDDALRRVWMVAGAFIEGLLNEGIDSNVSVKMLLGTLDRQLKKILDVGEEFYSKTDSDDLLKNMLYYVGSSQSDDKRIQQVKEAYHLEELIPSGDAQDAALISGLNADLFDTVSNGITEDMLTVKDSLEIFMHSDEQDTQQLVSVSERLGKIADTFGMLSMGATRQSIADQKDILNKVVDGEEEISETLVMGIASELLNAESDLKAFVERRSGYVDKRSHEDQIVPAAEYRQVILTVVTEALKNFAAAKEALLSYISGIGQSEQLDIILNKLEEVRGVAMMLPLGRIETQIDHLKTYVRKALLENNRQAGSEEQDTIADIVTSIEYYLEALSEGRPGIEHGLDTGDKAAQKLADICDQYHDIDDNEAIDAMDSYDARSDTIDDEITSAIIADDFSIDADREDVAETVVVDGRPEAGSKSEDTRPVTPVAVEDYNILSDDADEEIVEIFIEEAVEVLGEMHSCFPRWRDNNNDEEALADLRRSFHTLKGSGRLIGAELIGEFSWKFENILNRVIDNKIGISQSLFNAIDESLAVLPQLIEQLTGNREPISHIQSLMATADALAEGKDEAVFTAVPVTEENHDEVLDETAETEVTGDTAEEPVDEATTEQIDSEPEQVDIELESDEIAELDLGSEQTSGKSEIINADISGLSDSDDAFGASSVEANVEASTEKEAEEVLALAEGAGETDNKETVDIDGHDDSITIEDSVELVELSDDESDLTDDIELIHLDSSIDAESEDLSVDDVLEVDIGEEASEEADTALDVLLTDTGSVELLDVDGMTGEATEPFQDASDHTITEEPAEQPVDETVADEIRVDATGGDTAADDEGNAADSNIIDFNQQPANEVTDEIVGDEVEDSPAFEDKDSVDSSDDDEVVDLTGDVDDLPEADGEEAVFSEEISIDHSEISDADESDDPATYDIEIDEESLLGENELDIDPVLLKIYHDESSSHLANVRELLQKHHDGDKKLTADKDLNRAFHTLFGSARTAEVDAIAEISGAAEKYLKARQDNVDAELGEDAVAVFVDIEQAISRMLLAVEAKQVPENDKTLLERINKLLQQEMQSQLQGALEGGESSIDEVANDVDIALLHDLPKDIEEDVIDLSDTSVTNETESSESEFDQADDGVALDITDSHSEADVVVTDIGADEAADDALFDYADIDDDLIDIFLEEAGELLEGCEVTLMAMQEKPNSAEYIQDLQRNMHTLKGGARMADLRPVGDLTHLLESLVVKVSEQKVDVNNSLFKLLQESVDVLTDMMAKVKRREQLQPAESLAVKIQHLINGEIEEQRETDSFDAEPEDTDKVAQDSLPDGADSSQDTGIEFEERRADADDGAHLLASGNRASDKPHWGERASDVNFVESQELVRVRSDLLNNLVNYAGEVNIYHARLGKQVSDFSFNLSELSQTVVRLKEQLRKLEIETEIQIRSGFEKESDNYSVDFDPLEMDRYSTVQQLSRSLMETAGDVESINGILSEITRDSETLLLQESRVSTDLQEGLMRTRMVRFGGLSSRLRRIVRQISRELDKEVELKIIGEDSEVDRTILDRIIAPLEHMLRNAVAHGIEKPEQRAAAGKPETGTITVTVGRQGTNVVISVKDDGRGMDIEAIRAKAVSHNLIDENAELSDYDVLQFILSSGFSTADEVTQVSGRGVGMDVVDNEIKQLGGILEINTVAGQGSEFNIRLPLTLAINQALLVSTGEDVYAVPLASIEGVVRISGVELQQFYDSEDSHYEFNGVKYELKHLGSMLNGHKGNYSKQLRLFPVLLVVVGEQHFALHVDDLIGRREIVVKPVGMQIGAVRGIAGATILADGRVVLILELSALVVAPKQIHIEQPEVAEATDSAKPKSRTSIMVVDDSITIRKVTERILGRNGFDVILAKDGVDATNKMQDHIPDLMLLDIEMPRMDGFEVASYVRNDERLKDLPIIMITSRTGAKHKEKAMEIGVNQYLGKPYQEEELMSNINMLLSDVS